MVQPKQPPVSIRISDDLKARVAKFAEERKITRNAAYALLLGVGLDASRLPAASKITEKLNEAEMATAKKAAKLRTKAASIRLDAYRGGTPAQQLRADAKAVALEAEAIAMPKLSIQVGPIERKPGALMKAPKGSKK